MQAKQVVVLLKQQKIVSLARYNVKFNKSEKIFLRYPVISMKLNK